MNRQRFIVTVIRAGLFAALAFILVALGRKASSSLACRSCPGYGSCRSESDCSLYGKDKPGKK